MLSDAMPPCRILKVMVGSTQGHVGQDFCSAANDGGLTFAPKPLCSVSPGNAWGNSRPLVLAAPRSLLHRPMAPCRRSEKPIRTNGMGGRSPRSQPFVKFFASSPPQHPQKPPVKPTGSRRNQEMRRNQEQPRRSDQVRPGTTRVRMAEVVLCSTRTCLRFLVGNTLQNGHICMK